MACTCKPGFTGNGRTCADVDECATANGGCDSHASCVNTPGSLTCACTNGWTGNGMVCADIDECLVANGGCDVNAACTNTHAHLCLQARLHRQRLRVHGGGGG